jgi:hypothetical protein
MDTAEKVSLQVQQYHAEEMQTVKALRSSIAPVWVAAYGSLDGRDANGTTFDTFIAAVLDALPIQKGEAD